jgi:hypothetical protein
MPGQRAEGVAPRSAPLHKDLWDAVLARARSEGRTRTDVIRELLQAYVDGKITLPPPDTDS